MISDPCPYCADTGWFWPDMRYFPCPMCEKGKRIMAARGKASSKTKDDPKGFPQIKLITPPLQLSYPKIFDPEENDQGKDVWETDALVPPGCRYPKNHPKYPGELFEDVYMDALTEVMTKHFGDEEDWPRGRNDYVPKDKLKYVNPNKLPHPSVDLDTQLFRARSYQPVGIVDADKNEVTSKREAYGGRWAKLSLTITVYDQPQSKGPAVYLNNVQLLDNAESFGGRSSPDSDFEVEEGENGRGSGRRGRDRDDRDEGRGDARSREDRGRGGSRDRDDDRGDSRRDDGRTSRRGGRDEDRDPPSRDDGRGDRSRSARDRDDEDQEDNRGRSSRSRDEGDRRPSRSSEKDEGRSRSRDDDDRGYRGRDRHAGDDALEKEDREIKGRGSRGRDRDDREAESSRGGSRDRDAGGRDSGRGGSGGRSGGRSRDDDDREDEDRPSSRGRSSRREDDDDDRWN